MDTELGYLLCEVTGEELESVLKPRVSMEKSRPYNGRYLALADSLSRKGAYGNAMNAYGEVLKKNPGNIDARLGMGMLYVREAQLDEAKKEFQLVLKSSPGNPVALKGMGEVFLLKGDLEKAENFLLRAISANYMKGGIFCVMGDLYEKKGDLRKALDYYKKGCREGLK